MPKSELVRELRRRDAFADSERARREHTERGRGLLELREQALVAAQDAKERFLAILSHELRTPLTPILTLVTGLEHSEEVPPGLRPVFRTIRRNVETEARLIEQLLDVTRLDRFDLQLRVDILDLHMLVQDVLETYESKLRDAGIDVDVSLTAEARWVKGDRIRLSQVISNLLTNAVKFTPGGGNVSIRSENAEKRKIVISMIDNGIGFDPTRTETLFAPFEQAHYPGTRTGGLGLGLTISKGIVEAHGGRIWARSKGIGQGAEFAFELPNTDERPRRAPSAGAKSKPIKAQKPLRILLVEDHADSAMTMAELLERCGHRTKVAPDMHTALDVAAEGFDLILSDIALPDGSGIELMQRLRESKPVPGIALSGFGSEADIKNSLRAGFAEHLVKPVTFRQLLDAIDRVVRDGSQRSALGAQ